MSEKSDADILAESREYIETHGWTKGEMRNEDGHVCSLGAITFSQQWNDEDNWDCTDAHLGSLRRIGHKLLAALGIPVRERIHDNTELTSVASWNDNEARTEQEVLDLFAKAEKIERAGYDPDAGVTL